MNFADNIPVIYEVPESAGMALYTTPAGNSIIRAEEGADPPGPPHLFIACVPTAEQIRRHIRLWPDPVLKRLGHIYVPTMRHPWYQNGVRGRMYDGGVPGVPEDGPGIAIREDAFWRRVRGKPIEEGEFSGFLLDHEVAHVAVYTVWGTSAPAADETDRYGYNRDRQEILRQLYGANGLSDRGPAEDLAEAFHEYWGRHVSRTRGRQVLDEGHAWSVLELVRTSWADPLDARLRSDGRGRWPALGPKPPWVPPPMVEFGAWLDERIPDIGTLDLQGGETMAEHVDDLRDVADGIERVAYWIARDQD